MKQPGEPIQGLSSAYNEKPTAPLTQNLNIQNAHNIQKHKNQSQLSNNLADESLVSEKLDKKHVINLSTGN